MVDLVGDNQKIVFLAQRNQLIASVLGQGDTGGVLKGRDGVDEAWSIFVQCRDQRIDDQSILVDWDADDVEMVVGKDAQGQEVGRLFDKDRVTGSRKEGAD